MTDLDRLHERAAFLFTKLKATLDEIEQRGERPVIITRANGMLDTMRIDPKLATTPQVEEIRSNRAHSS